MSSLARGFGWMPDVVDFRDWNFEAASSEVSNLLGVLLRMPSQVGPSATAADVRERFCGGEWIVLDQRGLNASPAFAVLGAIEYYKRLASDSPCNLSHLFLY